jgi:hypothetical protein
VARFGVKGDRARLLERQRVHDFRDDVNTDRGAAADDHAAPAIWVDEPRKRVLVATSYHGTDLFLYRRGLDSTGPFERLAGFEGRYTYPRWFEYAGEVYLLARRQTPGVLDGDLVIRSSTDGFATERVVMASGEGHVIYASAPAVSDEGLVVHFSTLSYETRNLEGWALLHYNPEEDRVLGHVDLSGWIPDGCVTNRPTGIGVSEAGLVTLATACFPDGFRMGSNTDRFFARRNPVRILQLPMDRMKTEDRPIRVLHDGEAAAPYYHTSVAIGPEGAWFYFDADQPRSSEDWPDACFTGDHHMYPNWGEDALFYARPNRPAYEIRSFNNSVLRCPAP